MLTFFPLLCAKWLHKKSHLSFSVDRCIVLHSGRLFGNKGVAHDVCISSRLSGEILARKRGFLSNESAKSHDVLFERPIFIMRNTVYETSTDYTGYTQLTGSGAEETMRYGGVAFTFNPYKTSTALERSLTAELIIFSLRRLHLCVDCLCRLNTEIFLV